MPSETKTPRVAECVDYDDETGKRVPGTRVKATSNASATRPKLTRDRTSSKSKHHGDNTPPPSPHHHSRTKSSAKSPKESRKVVVEDDKKVKEERRRSGTVEKSNGSKRRSSSRPPSARDNFPKVRDEPSYFGVQPQTAPITLPSRPRASTSQSYGGSGRPLSYSGTPHPGYPTGAGPPLSSSAFYNAPTSVPTVPFGTSFPPPAGYQYAVVSQTKDYFAPQPRTLAERFVDPVHRASSAYGIRDRPRVQKAIDDVPYNYDDGYMSAAEQPTSIRTRRGSIREPSRPAFSEASRSSYTVSSKEDEDRERMPPPPRPILRKGITEYARDPSPAAVTLKYADSRPEYRDDHPRRALTRNSVSYDLGRSTEQFRLETANNGRRRQSYYGQSASTGSSGASGYEDKLNAAKGYQQEVTGEPVALTAENIKKQQRRQAGSTHSTKSSGSRSREESEYKYRSSATTRTTRSGSGADQNDENVTIKLVGSAKIVVGGAHLEIGKDGGEVQIKRQTSIRNGSEKSNSEYGEKESKYGERESRGLLPRRILDEDRRERRSRSRVDALRPELRSRMSSTNRTSQSYDRIRDTYANSHAQYYQPESVYQNGGWV